MIYRPHQPRRRAFTILELLIAISLLAIFALVATRITFVALRLLGSNGQQTEQSFVLDDLAARLRADVWSATDLRADRATLTLATADGTVTYSLTPETVARSSPAGARKVWRLATRNGSFSVEGPHILFTSDAGRLTFPSEALRLMQGRGK